MLDRDAALRTHGANVIDDSGKKIGTVKDIYLDQQTDQPEWALVSTGLVGGKGSFVPLAQATMQGNDIKVPYSKDMVSGAPSMDPDGQLSQQEEAELYRYYGLDYSEQRSDSGLPEGGGAPATGRDTASDDAMTRSEEELHVGTERAEVGRARLKKYVVTEDVQTTVPVQREEVRVEREPVTEANIDAATAGPEISETEHEVVLTEERPVVEKRTVPKERVRLGKEAVTDEKEVAEQVRKEEIVTEGDATETPPKKRR
jgi:uncharacterized protein (TIGR02271 family)